MAMAATLIGAALVTAGTASVALAQTPPSADERAAYTGLHAAAAAGDITAVANLAANGADLDARDSRGRTPLMVAAYAAQHEVAERLIAVGADINAFDNDRYDLLTIASVANDLTLVAMALASGADPGLVTSPFEGTALIASAHLGHVEVVRSLIAAGAPLDHVNNLGWTALIEAIVLGDGGTRHQDIVRLLVEAGADIDLGDGEGTRPLSLAHQRGYTKIAAILEGRGAQP